MKVYHRVPHDSLASVLKEGLKQTSESTMGNNKKIAKNDDFLDAVCPPALRDANVSRKHNIYCYLGTDNTIIDIRDGTTVIIKDMVADDTYRLLLVMVDTDKCYVSDLDIYDQIMKKTQAGTYSKQMATHYWNSLIPLRRYKFGMIHRPEVMVTYDISPQNIEVVT
jgi:hypothetical protein